MINLFQSVNGLTFDTAANMIGAGVIAGRVEYNRNEIFNVQIGEVSVIDPLGPDEYGYNIYDSGDDGYDLAPVYDWIEIDPSLGGNGIDLSLSNSGNGNWSGIGPIAHVDLPFPFKFYGVDYDEITVCTNGWIAFGYTDMESFRN